MSKVKVNPAYVVKCIDEIKRTNLSSAKRETIVKILSEYLKFKEIDLEVPQHFTKEQSDWIKAYCIKRNNEFYNQAINDFANAISDLSARRYMHDIYQDDIQDIKKELKGNKNYAENN